MELVSKLIMSKNGSQQVLSIAKSVPTLIFSGIASLTQLYAQLRLRTYGQQLLNELYYEKDSYCAFFYVLGHGAGTMVFGR